MSIWDELASKKSALFIPKSMYFCSP